MSAFFDHLPRPPTKAQRSEMTATKNPFKLLGSLSGMQTLLFLSGFYAWSMDAYDFFSVSLTVKLLAKQFGKEAASITTSITLTLLFRSLGALLFGVISDRYGRKWPLVANLVLVAVLQLGSGFVNTFPQFLAVRSLFGIGMGGIWGMSAATALENAPVDARGLLSGILQQGYAFGYLIAASVNLGWVQKHGDNWRVLFWLGSGLSLGAAIFRAILPESQVFLRAKEIGHTGNKTATFFHEAKAALKLHWVRCIYGVLLMTGFNFYSHGSQDLYPTYLIDGKLIPAKLASKATIIANCGAICGGILSGYVSQYLGRRLTIIVCCLWTACFIPLWIIPNTFGALSAGAFFVQFGVQGAWGVIPVYLNEIAPPAFRALFAGLAYQLGNMVSSASAQIEATAGKHLRTTYHGENLPDYAKIMGILIGVVSAWIIMLCLIGREYHGSHFEAAKTAFQEGAGGKEAELEVIEGVHDHHGNSDLESHHQDEKMGGDLRKESI